MLKLDIGGKIYLFPTKQSEISIRLGLEMDKIIKEMGCSCNPETQKFLLAEMIGADYDTVDLITHEQLSLLIDTHSFFDDNIKIPYNQYLKVGGEVFSLKVEDKTVREFAENSILADDEKTHFQLFKSFYSQEKSTKVKSLLLRLFLKNHRTWESTNYFNYKMVLWLYFDWKQRLMKEYGLSYDNDQIPEDQKDSTPIELKQSEKFGVYNILLSLCDYDYDKFERWLDRDILELFKYIAYMKVVRMEEMQSQPKV